MRSAVLPLQTSPLRPPCGPNDWNGKD